MNQGVTEWAVQEMSKKARESMREVEGKEGQRRLGRKGGKDNGREQVRVGGRK